MKNIKSKNKYYCLPAGRQGFSLIETLISVFLITVGLLATVALISKSMMESMDSRNQLIAGELAQEGIELVRNIRDNNWANGRDSFDNIITEDTDPIGSNQCFFSESGSLLEFAPSNEWLAMPGNFYVHGSGMMTPTKFKRKMIIPPNVLLPAFTPVSELKITSVVWWGSVEFLSQTEPSVKTNCNTANKCSYVQVTMSRWGE